MSIGFDHVLVNHRLMVDCLILYHMDLPHTVDQSHQLLLARQIEESFAGSKERGIEEIQTFPADARVQLVDLLLNINLSVGVGYLQVAEHEAKGIQLAGGDNIVQSPHVDLLITDDDKAHVRNLQLFGAASIGIGGEAVGIQGSVLFPMRGRRKFGLDIV